jgi:hypothetical protein
LCWCCLQVAEQVEGYLEPSVLFRLVQVDCRQTRQELAAKARTVRTALLSGLEQRWHQRNEQLEQRWAASTRPSHPFECAAGCAVRALAVI